MVVLSVILQNCQIHSRVTTIAVIRNSRLPLADRFNVRVSCRVAQRSAPPSGRCGNYSTFHQFTPPTPLIWGDASHL